MIGDAWQRTEDEAGHSQLCLFNDPKKIDVALLDYPEPAIRHFPNYLSPREADDLFSALLGLHGWRQDCINIYGKVHPLPRLHRWFAESGESYSWSGIEMRPEPFPVSLQEILARVSSENNVKFNTALGNLYRDGKDSVAWHSDDEPGLGPNPTIASLSLGATRRFLIRKKNQHKQSMTFNLSHGSLLVMSGSTQVEWEHCIPKSASCAEARINLTFRAINQS
ncbi:alpha-ketoglutarate-dependent dioxygenase AlkB [Cyanobium sp. T1B-Tous]|nr:alpha-ketoglutarate-dependent dioxygenase AlkB [Cyanobium sp. T1B-Tous]